jgi:hypothetical protein
MELTIANVSNLTKTTSPDEKSDKEELVEVEKPVVRTKVIR